MTWTLALDGLLVVLLAVTLAYAVQLNRRLGRMRADQAELERLALRFAEAAGRADDGIARLKLATGATREEIERAGRLNDDLRFLIDRGSSVADRLEAQISRLRPSTPPLPVAAAAKPATTASAAAPATPTTAAAAAAGNPRAAGRRQPPPAPPAAAAAVPAASDGDDGRPKPRSRAERELLTALRAAGMAPS